MENNELRLLASSKKYLLQPGKSSDFITTRTVVSVSNFGIFTIADDDIQMEKMRVSIC